MNRNILRKADGACFVNVLTDVTNTSVGGEDRIMIRIIICSDIQLLCLPVKYH